MYPLKNIQNCIQDSILMSHQLSQQAKVGGGESLTAAEKDKARGNILKEYFQRLINGVGDSKNATNEKSNEKNKIKCLPIFNFQSRKKFFLFCISSLPVLNGFNWCNLASTVRCSMQRRRLLTLAKFTIFLWPEKIGIARNQTQGSWVQQRER